MSILLIIAFLWLWVYFSIALRYVVCTIGAALIGHWCFMWALNFIGDDVTIVQVYGWFFMGLAGLMLITVIVTIQEIYEDVVLEIELNKREDYNR